MKNRIIGILVGITFLSVFDSCFFIAKDNLNKTILISRKMLVNSFCKPQHGDTFADLISSEVYKNKASAYYCYVVRISDTSTIYQYWYIAIGKGTFNFLLVNNGIISEYNMTKEKVKKYIDGSTLISKRKKSLLLRKLVNCEKKNSNIGDSF